MSSNQQTVYRLAHRRDLTGIVSQCEEIPKPTKHEVLIKIRSVALNYRDIAIATSLYPAPVKDNGIPCSDLAGDVIEVGDAVEKLDVGDKVVAAFDPTVIYGPWRSLGHGLGALTDGVLREYIVLPAVGVVKVGSGEQSYSEWASLVCTGVTSWNALYGNNPLKPGQTVLCLGEMATSTTGTESTNRYRNWRRLDNNTDPRKSRWRYGGYHIFKR
jgi:NADPH:quinone reductase-like Zn-dependent oxidoreductase